MDDKKRSVRLDTQPRRTAAANRADKRCIGLAANDPDGHETRLLLTPEACGIIGSMGFRIVMEAGAGRPLSFSDDDYASFGVETASRDKVLKCDVVLSFLPLDEMDICRMNPGATLLCTTDECLFEREIIDTLLRHRISLGCLDNMVSHNDISVFADILDELDGRGAILYAQHKLSLAGGGKGVILAGAAGIGPCEVLVIGDGNLECAAATAAIDAGADTTLMSNDIPALHNAHQICGRELRTLAIHPQVLYHRLRSADVVILGDCARPFTLPEKLYAAMKDTVCLIDLAQTHPSRSVPRSVAMAMSNALVNFFEDMACKDSFGAMLATTPGVQSGMVSYAGSLVDKVIASELRMPCVDIAMMLAASN